MKKTLLYTFFIFSISSSVALSNSATKEKFNKCIANETAKILSTTRSSAVQFDRAAPKGRLLRCRTKRREARKFGLPAKSYEKIQNVSCRLISAEFRPKSRTKIFTCGIKDGKPYAHTQVSGKGCEHDNYAVWEIKTTYKRTALVAKETKKISDMCFDITFQ